ncbi:MAG: MlaD family protein [Candidatus Obscuribacterales bacterium]|nr:MlaD family protein [Candidatus Obscuribacterales bacterium]
MIKTQAQSQSQRSSNDDGASASKNKAAVVTHHQRPNYEARVGLFVLIAVIILTYGWSWLHGLSFLHPPQRFTIHFHDIAGLNNNATVNVNGVRVGTVEKIELLKKGDVAVGLKISTELLTMTIPQNATFSIQTLGLVGAKYVEITLPEKAGAPMTADTQDIYGEDPVRIEVVINPLAKQLGAFDLKGIEDRLKRDLDHIDVMANSGSSTLDSYRETAPELHRIATALNKVAAKADKAAGSADSFFQNGSRLANDMRGTTARANRILENPALSSDLKETATQARLTAEKIQSVMKDINKTLGDSKVRGDVLEMMQKLQASAASIQQSIDRVGTISDDKGLRSDLKEIVTKTNTALDKVNDVVSQPTFGADLQGTLGKVRSAAEELRVAAENIDSRVTSKHWLRTGALGGALKNPAKVEVKKTTTKTTAPAQSKSDEKTETKTESKTDKE